MNMFNAILDMIQNEDFNAMSRIAIVNNDDLEDVLEDETEHEIESETDDKLEDETGDGTSYGKIQVPSTYTNLEETDIAIDHSKTVNEQGSPWSKPYGFHRYCLRHFINNFNDKFRNSQLKALAYRAGSQNQIRKFNSIMEEIGKINPKARQWLETHALERWTLAHEGGKRYGLLTTNLLVHYYDVRRPMGSTAQANGDMYTPHVLAKQAASMSKAGAHSLRSFNRQKGIFDVITQKGKKVQVSLNTWQYVDKCYSIVDYYATWSSEFSPLPHEAYWPNSSSIRKLLPNSELKRDKKGRPRSTRLRNGMDIKERKKFNLCGICKHPGHNRATCPSKPRRMDAKRVESFLIFGYNLYLLLISLTLDFILYFG
ncbi:hypothetical protein QVD17_30553 [Tagetes erecta]|uniref:Uncharacterized protein n=1 Tax=Tagetes erecta TaxID=13708 RepID=A0AAD8K2V1_TARER|nr:hypothetical protein QVD17_30553 [Tagetes erecta]